MHNGLLYLVILSAHLAGDFYFQTTALADKKEKNYSSLLLHSLIYMVFVVLVFLVFETPWWFLLIAAASHWLIDSGKWLLRNTKLLKTRLFILDQLLHLITLLLLTMLTPELEIRPWLSFLPETLWAWLALLLLILRPVNVSVDILFSKYATAAKEESKRQNIVEDLKRRDAGQIATSELSEHHSDNLKEPLEVEGAGAWVGALERIITVLFAFMGQFAAMGLLMAAKSMARYDKISKGPAFAEYYLIGTLFSILSAIVAYLFVFKIVFPVSAVIPPTPIILITPTPIP
jgi:hypothetical protein